MSNSITGKLIQMLPVETGQGKNGEWRKQSFVIETEEQYPKKVCLTAWGEAGKAISNVPENSNITLQFTPESREYNGRWYTELRAYKYTVNNVPVAQQEEVYKAVPVGGEAPEPELPF